MQGMTGWASTGLECHFGSFHGKFGRDGWMDKTGQSKSDTVVCIYFNLMADFTVGTHCHFIGSIELITLTDVFYSLVSHFDVAVGCGSLVSSLGH